MWTCDLQKEWWPVKDSGPTRLLPPRFPGHPPDSLDPVSLRPYQICFWGINCNFNFNPIFKKNNLYSHHLFDHPLLPRFEQPRSKLASSFGSFHTMAVAGWPTCKSGPTTMAMI